MPEWVVESSQLSDVGLKRRYNEDFVGFYEPGHSARLETHGRLYVLADGVGGAAAGEIASQYTVRKIIYAYYQSTHGELGARLQQAIEGANADVFARNVNQPDHREMATTVVAAVVHGDELIVANVGDSRAYLVRKEAIEQITEDHSLVAEMINDGSITAEQAETHPYRNVILRSIGAHENVKVDLFFRRLTPDDVFILCSDGLTRHVNKDELAAVIRTHPPAEAARQLVKLSNERGGYDNITVSITRMTPIQMQGEATNGEQLPEAPNWDDLHPAQ